MKKELSSYGAPAGDEKIIDAVIISVTDITQVQFFFGGGEVCLIGKIFNSTLQMARSITFSKIKSSDSPPALIKEKKITECWSC
jgi:hypothetical protein